jgi:aspartate aminotransferase
VTGALENLGLAGDADLVAHFLEEADVAMVPGSAFGASGYVRISFACSIEELQEAIGRMDKALA